MDIKNLDRIIKLSERLEKMGFYKEKIQETLIGNEYSDRYYFGLSIDGVSECGLRHNPVRMTCKIEDSITFEKKVITEMFKLVESMVDKEIKNINDEIEKI